MVGVALILFVGVGCAKESSGGSTPYATVQSFTGGLSFQNSEATVRSSTTEALDSDVSTDRFRCPSIDPDSIVTDLGSEEVRYEIDRVAVDLACRTQTLSSRLKEWRNWEEEKVRARAAQRGLSEATFQSCLRDHKLTESQWNGLGITDPSTPCVTEFLQVGWEPIEAAQYPGPNDQLFGYHNGWLKKIVALADLAEIYPDSVQPSRLPTILDNGRMAQGCLERSQWCFEG